jgi:hypothetical protein
LSSLDGLDDVNLFIGFGLVRVAGVLDRDLTTGVGSGNVHLHVGGKVVCDVGECLIMGGCEVMGCWLQLCRPDIYGKWLVWKLDRMG